MVMKEGGEVVGDAVQQYINIKQRYSSTLSLALSALLWPAVFLRPQRYVTVPPHSSTSQYLSWPWYVSTSSSR